MKKINSLHGLTKVSIAFVASLIALAFTFDHRMEPITRIMICWDVFAVTFLLMSWSTFMYTEPHTIRKVATTQDASHVVIFIIVLLASLLSIVAILLLLKGKAIWVLNKRTEVGIYLTGVILSWFICHTLFAFHYAHLFYDNDFDEGKNKEGGLCFPEENEPDYIDFAYFSYVIGMTFQVSDVTITSRTIRQNVLLHSIISFGFNTVIVALSVNAIINT